MCKCIHVIIIFKIRYGLVDKTLALILWSYEIYKLNMCFTIECIKWPIYTQIRIRVLHFYLLIKILSSKFSFSWREKKMVKDFSQTLQFPNISFQLCHFSIIIWSKERFHSLAPNIFFFQYSTLNAQYNSIS